MHSTPILNLLFDLGNVLIDIDIPGAQDRIRQLLRDDASSTLIENTLIEYECGRISTDIFLNKMISQSRREVQALDIIEAWNSMLIGMPPSRIEMLEQLHPLYSLYVLSNTNELHLEWVHRYVKREYGLNRFEDFFVTAYYSHQVGDRKPNASVFQYILADAGIQPSDTLFMDDMADNLETAARLGFHTHHVTQGEDVGDFLRQKLDTL